jgi:hypothetical protein
MTTKNFFQISFIVFALAVCAISTLSAQEKPYKGSIGFRTGYYGNLGLDAKFFLSEKSAIELVATTRRYGVSSIFSYRYNEVMGLYEIQRPLTISDDIPGVSWYVGGGGSVGFYSDDIAANTFSIAGVGGIEWTAPKIPLTISLDWMPRYFLSTNIYYSGISTNSGGFRIAYYFGGKNN